MGHLDVPTYAHHASFVGEGTGKASVTRKIGKVYYNLGFLSSRECIECPSSDLVGQYVGFTGPLVRKKLDEDLGKVALVSYSSRKSCYGFTNAQFCVQVLFIDEVYRLAEGNFVHEAIAEIVDCLTKERYRGRLIVIIASYEEDISRLFSVNRGLSCRFPEDIFFSSMLPEQCLQLLGAKLQKNGIVFDAGDKVDTGDSARLIDLFKRLSAVPGWGNARDIETLAMTMARLTFKDPANASTTGSLHLSGTTAIKCLTEKFTANMERNENVGSPTTW